jgi:hypothetical protein
MDIMYEKAAVCLAVLDFEITSQAQVDSLSIAMKPGLWPKWDNWSEWWKI